MRKIAGAIVILIFVIALIKGMEFRMVFGYPPDEWKIEFHINPINMKKSEKVSEVTYINQTETKDEY